jgi:sucrose-6-phosphate hydrolase SacC (GH32 family)
MSLKTIATLALLASPTAATNQCFDSNGVAGPCEPGREFCGVPFNPKTSPSYHLMDKHGCGENDPNGPSFDPVHGVIHHFYQIHLAANPGHGPDYGHFVSKDFVHWAPLPVAIWNGLDKSQPPNSTSYVTKYDNEAIFTGSAVLVNGAAPDGKSPGLVQIYPGLCNKNDWPTCETGTLLAQAVPADYANDQLLTNWSKPSYNPIMENTQRDPSTPWKIPSGEWRLRTYNSKVYGTASDEDMLKGNWYEIGTSKDFRQCECPSVYPLPDATPGTEKEYDTMKAAGTLPTHVHKTSCGGDWWQMGTYSAEQPKVLGTFQSTKNWEDVFLQRRIDQGAFYASKDNLYPRKTKKSGMNERSIDRRINWGWAQAMPGSTQTLPREITFNPLARQLQQLPIEEMKDLRKTPVFYDVNITVSSASKPLGIPSGFAKTSELIATFDLPSTPVNFGFHLGNSNTPKPIPVTASTFMEKTDMPGGDYKVTHMPPNTDPKKCEAACSTDDKCKSWTYVVRGVPAGSGDCCLKSTVPCPVTNSGVSPQCTSGAKTTQTLPSCGSSNDGIDCMISWNGGNASAPFVDVPVNCGGVRDTIRVLSTEKDFEIRVYSDTTFLEVFLQQGRTAMTVKNIMIDDIDYTLKSSTSNGLTVKTATVWPIGNPWVTPEDVRNAPRVYK